MRLRDFPLRAVVDRLAVGSRTPRLKAFTLLELMVVVTLIGIVSAVIIPEMRGTYQDALIKSTSRQLMGAIQLAGSRSVSLQRQHRLLIHSGKKQYRIEQKGGASPGFTGLKDVANSEASFDSRISVEVRRGEEPLGEEKEVVASALDQPTSQENQVESIIFYPDGTADERTITVRDKDGFSLVLVINPTTARVEFKEGPKE